MMKKIINIGYVLFTICLLNTLSVKAQEEDSLVNVAFGTVAKKDLLGAVSTVNVSELMKKSYSRYSLNGISSFVGGYNGNIWGQGGLVLVDGIPRSAYQVQASEIESVTILKGASAVVLYGSLAAKGVVLITTKRGQAKPLTVDVRANAGFYVPKGYPKYLNASSYMTLYNEAIYNDGLENVSKLYTNQEIERTNSGTNPYRYPDIDFFSSEYLRKAVNLTNITTEISGGNERTRYYTNVGASYNNSLMNYGTQKKNDDLQINLRGNIDIKLSDWLNATTNVSAIFEDNYRGTGDFWGNSATLRPNWVSPLVPLSLLIPGSATDVEELKKNTNHLIDGEFLLGGRDDVRNNVFGDMQGAGYSRFKSRLYKFDIGANADLSGITKGLSLKTTFGIDFNNFYSETWNSTYATYKPTWNAGDSISLIEIVPGTAEFQPQNENIGTTYYDQTLTLITQLNYNRTFAESHNVSASLIGWGFQTIISNSGGSTYHPTSNVNLGMQTAYNYRQKYYFDFSGAVVHSTKLPEANRTAFSPSVTLGWRISDENFFKNNISFVDNFMLTASYANLNQDIDINDFYMYKGSLKTRDTPWYSYRDGVASGFLTMYDRSDNLNLSFVQREEYRAGFEAAFLKNFITLDANYFLQYTKGRLVTGENTIYPSYFRYGDFSYAPYLNYNEDKRSGIDFSLNLNKKIGNLESILGFSGMFFSSEAIRRDEVQEYDYLYSTGKPLDAQWGLIAEGFFRDNDDITNSREQKFGGTVMPGDIKYRDVNGDTIIDAKDVVNHGSGGWYASPFNFGIHITLKWKNLTFFALGTGNTGAVGFKNGSYYWIKGSSKYSEVVNGRWTEATKDIATYPRLTTTEGANNFRNSTFWMYKTDRFDLSKVQITYDFSQNLIKKTFFDALSVYLTGESLLTLSKERKLMETNIGSSPQYRLYSFGVKASF